MRVVLSVIDAPRGTASATRVADAVRAAADRRDLGHVYASSETGSYGVVLYLLVPLEAATTTALRILFEVGGGGTFGPGWSVAEVAAWDPAESTVGSGGGG